MGQITPETIIETEDGKTAPARKVKGLTFAESVPPIDTEVYGLAQPPKSPATTNPFTSPKPGKQSHTETNPFVAVSPAVKAVEVEEHPYYFYINASGNKRGPYNEQQLQGFADRNFIVSTTPLETEGGHKGLAGQIPGLKFNNVAVSPATKTVEERPYYYYTDANGQKYGPLTKERLQTLIKRGAIRQDTPLETDTGHQGLAGQIPGLDFSVTPFVADGEEEDATEKSKSPTNPVPIFIGIGALLFVFILIGIVSNSGGGKRFDSAKAGLAYMKEILARYNEVAFSKDFKAGDSDKMLAETVEFERVNTSSYSNDFQVAHRELCDAMTGFSAIRQVIWENRRERGDLVVGYLARSFEERMKSYTDAYKKFMELLKIEEGKR